MSEAQRCGVCYGLIGEYESYGKDMCHNCYWYAYGIERKQSNGGPAPVLAPGRPHNTPYIRRLAKENVPKGHKAWNILTYGPMPTKDER